MNAGACERGRGTHVVLEEVDERGSDVDGVQDANHRGRKVLLVRSFGRDGALRDILHPHALRERLSGGCERSRLGGLTFSMSRQSYSTRFAVETMMRSRPVR